MELQESDTTEQLTHIYSVQQSHSGHIFMHPKLTAAPLTTAKTRQQPTCPATERWIKVRCAAIKKNKIMPLAATRTDLEVIWYHS